MRSIPRQRASLALAAMAACASFHAQAVDIDAGDYTALPPGTTLGMVYYSTPRATASMPMASRRRYGRN